METVHEIETRMEKIRAIFQHIMSAAVEADDVDVLEQELNATEVEFRSIAYEAAAMSLALKDIAINDSFNNWQSFMQMQGAKHLTQVHIGLGWAMAQQQFPVFPFIETLEPLMQCRVIDGYGYYEGIFRKRKAIGEMKLPQELPQKFLNPYDQGLGRSIWYNTKADCEKIAEMLSAFNYERQKDLWRGIGIACVYVGGYDENLLRQLAVVASTHRTQLSVAAALVTRTRAEASSYTNYTEMACRTWCECSEEQALTITTNAIPTNEIIKDDPYGEWISNIEEAFAGIN